MPVIVVDEWPSRLDTRVRSMPWSSWIDADEWRRSWLRRRRRKHDCADLRVVPTGSSMSLAA
ncbi:hypothetical protein BCD48_38345 [Pseudofrankia sp. BMG5.36]|nr:hypothetical protein BCD48_38345 [Pseudofrankia sp. BMG5.36]